MFRASQIDGQMPEDSCFLEVTCVKPGFIGVRIFLPPIDAVLSYLNKLNRRPQVVAVDSSC